MNEGALLELSHRAPIYAWLAPLLIAEVDAASWRALRAEPVRSMLARLDPALEGALERELTSDECEAYAEEFARLFLLPNGVSPFASSWIEAKGMPERSRDELVGLVERGFESLGRAPQDGGAWGRVPRDHVALILDLVAQATFQSDQAAQAKHSTQPEERDIAAHLAAHLDTQLSGDWIARFAGALEEESRLPLYRALGRLLGSLQGPLEANA